MKIVFLSCYFNHHQRALSSELARLGDYAFISTDVISESRRTFGWGESTEPEYVINYDSDRKKAESLLESADVVITGSAPESLVQKCIKRGQLVFRYSERPLKKGDEPLKYLPRLVKWRLQNPSHKKIYMLCASAYTASDYKKFGLFSDKAFRWGYFPETKKYDDISALINKKKKASILWAGRFLDWKHPDDAVRLAAMLKSQGYDFELRLIGTGDMLEPLVKMIEKESLGDCVKLLGAMKPEEVRRHMEQSQIYLFTSDRKEGWGAVLNEAMNSGCAVVASKDIGSAPYLVNDGENGFLYPSGNVQQLCECVKELLDLPEKADKLGANAYKTIADEWNAEAAAQRFLALAESVLSGGNTDLFESGPCSRENC